jgi:hypothetical protein
VVQYDFGVETFRNEAGGVGRIKSNSNGKKSVFDKN